MVNEKPKTPEEWAQVYYSTGTGPQLADVIQAAMDQAAGEALSLASIAHQRLVGQVTAERDEARVELAATGRVAEDRRYRAKTAEAAAKLAQFEAARLREAGAVLRDMIDRTSATAIDATDGWDNILAEGGDG